MKNLYSSDISSEPIDSNSIIIPELDNMLDILPNVAMTTVIERFAVPNNQQTNAINRVLEAARDHWQHERSCVGFALLRSRDPSGGLAIYSQWHDAHCTFEQSTVDASHSMASVLSSFVNDISENFSIAFTAQAADVYPLSKLSKKLTPFVHFGVFRLKDNNNITELLQRAQEVAPNSLSVRGLRAINFHRGASGRLVVNVGLWDTFDHFSDLHRVPGFTLGKQYYTGIAEMFKPDFFDVVAVRSKNFQSNEESAVKSSRA